MMSIYPSVSGFRELESWLSGFKQTMGAACSVCQTGDLYVEIFESALSRRADVNVIEREVASKMKQRLEEYFKDRHGLIYWRIPFETSIGACPQVIRPDEASDDIDYPTGRRCIMDKEWVSIRAYCRLFKAKHLYETSAT